jgi:hypothetical protein
MHVITVTRRTAATPEAILRESVGGGLTVESGRWETEHPRDAARRQLTDIEIDRAWAQGRTMGLEDAVGYVRTA